MGCLITVLYCVIFAAALLRWDSGVEMLLLLLVSLPALLLFFQLSGLKERLQSLETALAELGQGPPQGPAAERAGKPDQESDGPERQVRQPEESTAVAPVAAAPDAHASGFEFSLDLEEYSAKQADPAASRGSLQQTAQPAGASPLEVRTRPMPRKKIRAQSGDSPGSEQSAAEQQADTFARFTKRLASLLPENPVAGVGLILLFLGVSFLFKYAAQHNLIAIEYRFLAVAAGALGLTGWGWKLRSQHRNYALSLQGGGVALLYLTIFAAARLYGLLPWSLAFVLMLLLVALSTLLAILQNARILAVLASSGGFAAPLLTGEASSSHIPLFLYYSLLNCGILAIAWFKSWRELNVLGFFFTFAIAGFWGYSAYTPQHFAGTEPFLLFHFVLYALVAVAFALRQPFCLYSTVDSTLVFALPAVVAGLQAGLVKDMEYGMAVSSLGFAAFYLLAAWLLRRQWGEALRALCEAFLAIGVVFVTIAIPLALSADWTTALWALEGAALVWLGLRQERLAVLVFGLLVQFFAGLNVLAHPLAPLAGGFFLTHPAFLGRACITAAALLSHYWLQQKQEPLSEDQARLGAGLLLLWALLWWYGGGIIHLAERIGSNAAFFPQAMLLYAALSSAVLLVLTKRVHWPGLWPALALLPLFMVLSLFWHILQAAFTGSLTGMALLARWGWLAWPLAALTAVFVMDMLQKDEDERAFKLLPYVQSLLLWLALFIAGQLCAWFLHSTLRLPPDNAWVAACWGLAPLLVLAALARSGKLRVIPPMLSEAGVDGPPEPSTPFTYAILFAVLALQLWVYAGFRLTAQAAPLPYIPLLNPLELAAVAVILGSFWYGLAAWQTSQAAVQAVDIRRLPAVNAALLAFALLNAVIARMFHHWAGLPYRLADMLRSTSLQASLSLVWTMLALSLTILAAKKGWRRLWLIGTGLLGLVVCKLMIFDLAGVGTIARIVSFVGVGLLMVLIGFFAPPPRKNES